MSVKTILLIGFLLDVVAVDQAFNHGIGMRFAGAIIASTPAIIASVVHTILH